MKAEKRRRRQTRTAHLQGDVLHAVNSRCVIPVDESPRERETRAGFTNGNAEERRPKKEQQQQQQEEALNEAEIRDALGKNERIRDMSRPEHFSREDIRSAYRAFAQEEEQE